MNYILQIKRVGLNKSSISDLNSLEGEREREIKKENIKKKKKGSIRKEVREFWCSKDRNQGRTLT